MSDGVLSTPGQTAIVIGKVMPPEIAKFIPLLTEELKDITESDAITEGADTEPTTSRLRLAFWTEYDSAIGDMRVMSFENIQHATRLTREAIMKILINPKRLAWVLTPPASYEDYISETLNYGIRRLREDILTMNIRTPNGDVDTRKAKLLMDAIAFVDLRKHGGIVQKSMHMHAHTNTPTPKMDIASIEERIRELEANGIVGKVVEKTRPKLNITADDIDFDGRVIRRDANGNPIPYKPLSDTDDYGE